jgi:DNA modification methylase
VTVTVKPGHVLDVLASLPPKSVHVCVTSPPYWGLRAYGTPPQVWGAAEGCECVWGPVIFDKKRGQDAGATARAGNTKKRVCPPETQQGAFCQRCGAWRGELGSEPTLELFVAHLVEVFEGVKRVLRDDGTLWVNLGDSYNHAQVERNADEGGAFARTGRQEGLKTSRAKPSVPGLKTGDLCMAPARFALAMQEAGWRLRSEITLCKTAPMPESVQGARFERCRVRRSASTSARTPYLANAYGEAPQGQQTAGVIDGSAEWADCPGCPKCAATDGYVQRWGSGRPTSATEKLYVFAKGSGPYFYDIEAVRVPNSQGAIERFGKDARISVEGRKYEGMDGTSLAAAATRMPVWQGNGRNLWNYVMWSPEPLQAAHYAAYPRWLPRLAIQAGTSERGVCPSCGAPHLRIVDKRYVKSPVHGEGSVVGRHYETGANGWDGAGLPRVNAETTTLGWRPSCPAACHQGRPAAPATCLDPFSGSGTTVIEANALGRHGIGIELQAKYVDIAHQRLSGQPLSLFAQEAAG